MDISLVVNKLSNCLRRRSAEIQKSVGVTGTQGMVLDYILMEGLTDKVCQKDIEREFGLRPSTATELLQTMELAGIIRRVPDSHDARRKNIEFTQQADDIRKALKVEMMETESLLLQGITPEEHVMFLAVGQKMLHNLELCRKSHC